ncbi:hypothetical protein RchiOBHm_Chr1g0362331 [Rosa chinensis]|uniref:Uncharacterized protein n=1 Tax=Rosa chinensis TaxID=74649 RepID=A0A2P6SJ75_ROSCH|nr:hypothetical protein RchiOBHm_Chr1g0362331 [Rosa chinensis]
MRLESPRISSRPSYIEPPKLIGLWKHGLQQRISLSFPFARFNLVSPSLSCFSLVSPLSIAHHPP